MGLTLGLSGRGRRRGGGVRRDAHEGRIGSADAADPHPHVHQANPQGHGPKGITSRPRSGRMTGTARVASSKSRWTAATTPARKRTAATDKVRHMPSISDPGPGRPGDDRGGTGAAGARPACIALLVLLAGSAPAAAQPGYQAELSTLGEVILGDWYEIERRAEPVPRRIRLQPDGLFLTGIGEDFGRFPSVWRAARTTLITQETLTVRWPEQGQCSYYVGFAVEGTTEIMTWRPYTDDRDFGGFDGILTRAVMPWGPCGPRTWSRQPPPAAAPASPPYPG